MSLAIGFLGVGFELSTSFEPTGTHCDEFLEKPVGAIANG